MRELTKARRLAATLAMALAAVGCATAPDMSVDPLETAAAAIARETGPLEDALLPQNGPGATRYLAFADAVDENYRFDGRRVVGTVGAGGNRIGAVLLLPRDGGRSRGTILAFHGYMSYGGHILSALERLANGGWAVIVADLPGHGFSDGKRGDIRDFADYGLVASGMLAWAERQGRFSLPRPFVLLGHSAGSIAVLEALWHDEKVADAAILLSPLVKPVGYWAASLSPVLEPFVGSFASRKHRDGYLGLPRMPLHWVRELVLWNGRLPGRPALDIPVLIVQGTADDVVDWRSNIPFLQEKIAGAKVVRLEGRGHNLPLPGKARDESLSAIAEFLDGVEIENDSPSAR